MPDNKEIAINDIAALLGFDEQRTSRGGTVTRPFVVQVAERLGVPTDRVEKVDLFRHCLERLEVPWQPRFASTDTRSGGGGNITLTGLEALRDAIETWLQDSAGPDRAASLTTSADADLALGATVDSTRRLLGELQEYADREGAFEPDDIADARERVLRGIVLRRGQATFRAALLRAFGGRCAMTGCDVPDALEAAHIVPYRGADTNDVGNGLLLRADVHTLFDLGLVTVDPDRRVVVVSPRLVDTTYGSLAGRPLNRCVDGSEPSRAALAWHRAWTGL